MTKDPSAVSLCLPQKFTFRDVNGGRQSLARARCSRLLLNRQNGRREDGQQNDEETLKHGDGSFFRFTMRTGIALVEY